ncbi:MAG TPA: ATP-binding protein [Bacteroidia bacterium]|nr:ATP-binding protein [Bacteroidia bacterium]
MSLNRRLIRYLLLSVALFVLAFSLKLREDRHALNFVQLAERAQSNLIPQIDRLNALVDSVHPLLDGIWLNDRAIAARINAEKLPDGISLFVYDHNQIRYWSDNKSWIDTSLLKTIRPNKINFLGNGWYYVAESGLQSRKVIGLLLIKHQYAVQNKYLVNSFNPVLELSDDARLITADRAGTSVVNDKNGEFLFSLYFPPEDAATPDSPLIAVILGLAFIVLFVGALDWLIHLGRRRIKSGMLLIAGLWLLRYLMISFRWPSSLYSTELFSPKMYAISFLLNSPGDLLLTIASAVLMIVYAYMFFTSMMRRKERHVNKITWSIYILGILLITFLSSVIINYLMSGLIIYSQISFNIANVFELTGYSMAGMFVIGMMLVALYLICDAGVQFIKRSQFNLGRIMILFLVSQGLFLLILNFFRSSDYFVNYGVSAFLLANSLIIFIGYIRGTEQQLFSFTRNVLVILAFSLYAAQIIYVFNQEREKAKRIQYAGKLEIEQDIVAEYLFDDIEQKLKADPALVSFFTLAQQQLYAKTDFEESVNRRLIRQYFNGYLARYEVGFKYFTPDGIPLNKKGDPTYSLEYLNKIISENSRPTGSVSFNCLADPSGRISYIGTINVFKDSVMKGIVVIELNSRRFQEDNGFPDLLLGNKWNFDRDVNHYSYARYRQGKLISQSGSYNYYLTSAPYEEYYSRGNGDYFSFDGYTHYFLPYDKEGLIIVSLPVQGIWVFITLFSYLFTVFSVIFLLTFLLFKLIRNGWKFEINFNSRIQVTIVAIVVCTLLLTGLSTVIYIYKNYEQAQKTKTQEKLNNILSLVENQIGNRELGNGNIGDDLEFYLNQLSSVLTTDFNVYSLNGLMLFSTQPKIYEQELVSPLMNRSAYVKLTASQKALFMQIEKVGKLSYIGAYEPIRNSDNKIIGYLNLPYFAKETELKRDISTFLVALINIYVLLFSLAILIAFLISNRITEPLRIIQQSLKRTKLGALNQPIYWRNQDEIGALINEYNRMLEELQRSAELLAKSERESAWREMAKQVAHEIKNPLTPMKLGVQHLQRAWNDNHPNKDEMIKRISNTLIEQIETLSNIATEFSNFAKLPKPEFEEVNLTSVLQATADLYNQTENMNITFSKPEKDVFITGDKDQLLRVFSNLVKNAVQAIPEEQHGEVKIQLSDDGSFHKVDVADNGSGIPDELIDKIFVPNFTTKTSGTGLGLAMVKSMVEGMGGSINFETKVGAGTVFTLRFLK